MAVKHHTLAAAVVLFCAAGVLARTASAQTAGAPQGNAVFQVGKFDGSSLEFARTEPTEPVNFNVGVSDPAHDWFRTQRAVNNGAAAGSRAPWTIHFKLAATPQGSYLLRISALLEAASVPALHVAVNGHNAVLYLHPKLDYRAGDEASLFYPAYSSADTTLEIPARDLRSGDNAIAFQAVEDATETIPDASLTYDAIALEHASAKEEAHEPAALILPTIFYHRADAGLAEQISVFVRSTQAFTAGSDVKLTVGGKTFHQALPRSQEFGEEQVDFLVPEFPGSTRAELSWQEGGREQHTSASIAPKKKWTVRIVPHIHVDVGYSDYQAKVAAIQGRDIDEALSMIDSNPDFRYSLDGEWDLQQFSKTHTAAEQQRALQAMQQHKLYLPAQYANVLTGFPTAETLIRSLYPSADFSREHNLPFNYANITDVPSYSWSYASVLAAAGIHYLAGGSNNDRAPVLMQGRLNENSPIWWQGPDGGKVLLWYSRIYQQMQALFGLPPVIAAGHDSLPLFLQMYERPEYKASETMIYGTQVENTDLFPQQATLVNKWNSLYEFPKLQYSGFYDALTSIEKQMGDSIPTMHGDGGPYWEDGIGSDAYYAAMERWNEGRAPTAEKLATITSVVNPLIRPDKESLDKLWENMVLMDEHTWSSDNSISDPTSMEATGQLAIKDSYAVHARALADWITKNSMATVVSSIPVGSGHVVVFNSLNWKRSGLVSLDLGKGNELVDETTGQPVSYEIRNSGKDFNHIQFTAEEVPAVGYKIYAMRRANASTPPAAASQQTTLENTYYRVVLDPSSGGIRSIYDKQLQRELVDGHSPYRFAQYLYVTGGDNGPNTVLQYGGASPRAELTVHPAGGGSLVSVTHEPWGWEARLRSSDINTPAIESEIRLFDKEKKIEFLEDVNKKEVDSKEGVYFAFPFAMPHPEFNYEVQNGVVNPAKDMYPGAGHEWFSIQHWISLQQDNLSVGLLPLDAPLATFGDINRGLWPREFGERQGSIFSYAMNNYWHTNYRAGQGGHFTFHYVLTSAASVDAPALSHLGWEEITPLETDTITSQDRAIAPAVSAQPAGTCELDPKQGSFVEADTPNVLLETWKAAEDGNGTILRFLNLSGDEQQVRVSIPLLHMQQAWRTDAVERDHDKLNVVGSNGLQLSLHPHEIASVRVRGGSTCSAH